MLQQHSYGKPVMPLLMGFTPLTPIQNGEINERYIYDDIAQITEYDMRTVGTKSLKQHGTSKNGRSTADRKNEIDDTKSVK